MISEIESVKVTAYGSPHVAEILTPGALQFLATLHREFAGPRENMLKTRQTRQAEIDAGNWPDFLSETESVRADKAWRVAPAPVDLRDRRVEITGPVERKMIINALNSGANVFMADFEDANSPTWQNVLAGQHNLRDAVSGTISLVSESGKTYELGERVATLVVRPRGWHLHEKHVLVDGKPISASIFDFGLYFYHNADALLRKASGPYFYLPKLESHREARLWNGVFCMAQDLLGVPRGSIRATVLIETILAAFEMEEILFELREHSAGLNAGRWDYIFSIIKKFRNQPDFLMPDRAQITMQVPFMQAYSELLVKTCHKRGAHAIGGMAAFIPSKDPEANALAFAKVREDKIRESQAGFDGTWVAHPGLVPVARECFDIALGAQPNQQHRLREDVQVSRDDLLNFNIPGCKITEAGFRTNINVGILYLESWLRGIGAAALYNLMEDAATAEISRAQVWQWLRSGDTKLDTGRPVNHQLYQVLLQEEVDKIASLLTNEHMKRETFAQATELFNQLVTNDSFSEFLTLEAYKLLD